jgi:hypothetical protein
MNTISFLKPFYIFAREMVERQEDIRVDEAEAANR